MTGITPSQIGQIRTIISWIQTEAQISKYNSGHLGHPNTNVKVYLDAIDGELHNIEFAAKQARDCIAQVKKEMEQDQ